MDPASRFVIAVFDEWSALRAVLEELKGRGVGLRGAVLFAREDDCGMGHAAGTAEVISAFLAETTELPFAIPTQKVRCTSGVLAQSLVARSAGGAQRLAGALGAWISREHANALQRHLEVGRLVLWLEIARPRDLEVVCGHLVQKSPHVVGMCSVEASA